MRISLLVCVLLAAPLTHAASQQKVDIRMRAIPAVSVRLGGAISSVRVIGWDRDSVALTGTLGPGSKMQGGPMANTTVVIGMKFFVDAPDESSLRVNKLELRVPALARVWIKGGSADVEASGVTGSLDLNIVGGSMDGGVSVTGSPEFARVKTATGDIVLQGGGEDVTLTTVSGSIRAADGTVQRGRFESVTGPIVFAGDFARGGDAKFDTHSGAIEVRLARRANVEIDAESITGSIENAWSSGRPAVGREGRGMQLGTSSGMSGARVSIRSFKGSIKLAPR